MFSSRRIAERIGAHRREMQELRSNCILVASCSWEDEHDASGSTEYYGDESEYGDEEFVWEEEDEYVEPPDEEGTGWGEDIEVNEYNGDNLRAAPEPDPPNLCCPICLNTVCRPVATLCMHVFCDECIYDVLRHGSLSCPLCRAPITEPPEPDTILDRYLEQMIADGAVTEPSGGRSSPYTWRDVNFPQH
ncbi:hypothetical protein B0H16DRAFT_1530910 [Mycena metata]|uniref:RING-type domain-containing protein n=1 Tax=Mycena metata TaxID=1033252 RepID=A0AAD7NI53_9AGAR|nr:hypothetical protein B0H16DRAFT_1530910 [Mycena metata]